MEGDVCKLKLEPRLESYVAGELIRVQVPKECWQKAEEGELLLRLPGLRIKAVRLTALQNQLPGPLQLTVPHLPGVRAWFELRVGSSGREWIAARSQEFFIAPINHGPVAAVAQHQGEWWLTPAPQPEVSAVPTVQRMQQPVNSKSLPLASFSTESTGAPQRHCALKLLSGRTKDNLQKPPDLPSWPRQVSLPLLE
ncbi:hypothetical protein HRbin09_01395 [bacterium HR09]|nr:hypothetical protein HRbin09_01395 [bacterium HR09]